MPYLPWSKTLALEVLATTCDLPGPVLISLQALQAKFGFIPDEAIKIIAQVCNVSRADVHGVLTYYHDLRTTPPPRCQVRICVAEACQAVGSRQLVSATEKALGVGMGAQNSSVEIQAAYCFGNCALGPTVMVDGRLLGRVSSEVLVAHVRASS